MNEQGTNLHGFHGLSHVENGADFERHPTSIPLLPRDCRVLLLDIEGCTSSISFVKQVLFPFVEENIEEYLATRSDREQQEILSSLSSDLTTAIASSSLQENIKLELQQVQHMENKPLANANNIIPTILSYVRVMMKWDVKATGLKELQGKLWYHGYTTHKLHGHVYEDFLPMLQWCQKKNVSVNIYSSGSIQAQQLLFTFSTQGDLSPYIHRYFDTTFGGKKNPSSYQKIAQELQVELSQLCFVSDSEEELWAAREAGVGFTVMSVRYGNAPLTPVGRESFPLVFSLLQLCGSGQ